MICLHCIGVILLGLLALVPFVGTFFMAWKHKLIQRLNESCEDEKCSHHEEEEQEDVD